MAEHSNASGARLRKRAAPANDQTGFRTPGHPATTLVFVVVCWLVVAGTIWRYPMNSAIGLIILMIGILAYFPWKRRTTVDRGRD